MQAQMKSYTSPDVPVDPGLVSTLAAFVKQR